MSELPEPVTERKIVPSLFGDGLEERIVEYRPVSKTVVRDGDDVQYRITWHVVQSWNPLPTWEEACLHPQGEVFI